MAESYCTSGFLLVFKNINNNIPRSTNNKIPAIPYFAYTGDIDGFGATGLQNGTAITDTVSPLLGSTQAAANTSCLYYLS